MARDISQIRILSIDGGGVRGIMPAYWLTQLERQLQEEYGQTLYQTFDWFIGTSTGSIIAAALANGKTAQEILNLYQFRSAEIFPTFFSIARLSNPLRWSGFVFPKFSDAGLNSILKEQFQDLCLSDIDTSQKRLMIVAYSAGQRQQVVFDSEDPATSSTLTWQACRASSAAPTYLPEFEMELKDNVPMSFLDGGVAANDPSAIGLSKVLGMRLEKESAVVVSLGTGQSGRGFSPKRYWFMKWGGQAGWATSIVSTLMDGSNRTFEAITEEVLGVDDHKFRFNTPLSLASHAMDDASPHQINALIQDAAAFWGSGQTRKRIGKLLPLLKGTGIPDLSNYAGTWKSEFDWGPSAGDSDPSKKERASQLIRMNVVGRVFLHGQTLPGEEYPGTFEAGLFGDKIVGQWYNKEILSLSTFVLSPSPNGNELKGYWIGGEGQVGERPSDAKPGEIFHGEWILTRA